MTLLKIVNNLQCNVIIFVNIVMQKQMTSEPDN